MPAVTPVSATGNNYIDGLIDGNKWAVSSLTFSFPSDAAFYGVGYGSGEPLNNFEAFNATQQAAVRAILAWYSKVVPLTFTEVTESASVHGDLRFGMTDGTASAHSYGVTSSATGGDCWFRNTGALYDAPDEGNYGWLTMVHEIGHSLGLKHPHEGSPILPSDRDALEYTVMSYRSYPGASLASYSNATWGYPSTPMTRDIETLTYFYGSPTAGSSNITYHINPTTGAFSVDGVAEQVPGADKVFRTLAPRRTSGVITLDLSDYADNLDIDLRPDAGSLLQTAELADLGGGNFAARNLYMPKLYGGQVDAIPSRIKLGGGDDTLIGNGTETLVFTGNRANYTAVANLDGTTTLTDNRIGSPDGAATFEAVAYCEFADGLKTVAQLFSAGYIAKAYTCTA